MASDVIEGQSFAGCDKSGHVWRKHVEQDLKDEEPQVCVCVCDLISMWSRLLKWRLG